MPKYTKKGKVVKGKTMKSGRVVKKGGGGRVVKRSSGSRSSRR